MEEKKLQMPHLSQASVLRENETTPHVVESFRVDEFTGAAGITIPIETTVCRGADLGLSLHYQQGVMNSAFGVGFSLDLPKFIRSDRREIPRYQDEKDLFEFTPEGELTKKEAIFCDGVNIQRYQPIVERAFTKIEFHKGKDIACWKIIAADGTVCWYGKSDSARLSDKNRAAAWLLEDSVDNKGNKVHYTYEKTGSNPYLKSIRYGNYMADGEEKWAMEVQFLYKERKDVRTSCRSGFPVTSDRLCTAVHMLHHIEGEHLVRSTDFVYEERGGMSFLANLQVSGFQTAGDGEIYKETSPPLTFSYEPFQTDAGAFHNLSLEAQGIPALLQNGECLFLDLYGEGIAGILYYSGSTLFYCTPLGSGRYGQAQAVFQFPVHKAMAKANHTFGSVSGAISYDLIIEAEGFWGFYPWENGRWGKFQPLPTHPLVGTVTLDLQGDGLQHRFFIKQGQMLYFPALKEEGFGAPAAALLPQEFPASLEKSPSVYVGFQDVLGDGLLHRLRVRDGSVECWPNLGYGKFGEKKLIPGAPHYEEGLWAERLYFADLDGSGPCDLIYVKDDCLDVYPNRCGTHFEKPFSIPLTEKYAKGDFLQFADVAGKGRSNILFFKMGCRPACYVYEFPGIGQPYLLKEADTNRGLSYGFNYKTSVDYYLQALKKGKPWKEPLPLSVTVISSMEKRDNAAGTVLKTTYDYREGRYHRKLRQFMGFSYIETVEQAQINKSWYEEPQAVYRKAWYYTGTEEENQRAQSLRGSLKAFEAGSLHESIYTPYSSMTQRYQVRELKPPQAENKGAYQVLESDTITLKLEGSFKEAAADRSLFFNWDSYGNPLKQSECFFFINNTEAENGEQLLQSGTTRDLRCLFSCHQYLNLTEDGYRLSIPLETKTYEIQGILYKKESTLLEQEFEEALKKQIVYQADFPAGEKSARLQEWTKAFYWNEEETKALPFGASGNKALLHHMECAVIEASALDDVFSSSVTETMMTEEGGYQLKDGCYWNPGNVMFYDAQCFFLPCREEGSALSVKSQVEYDQYGLMPVKFSQYNGDQILSVVNHVQYEGMYINRVRDCNGNVQEVFRGPLGHLEVLFSYGTVLGEKQGSGSLADYKMIVPKLDKILENPAANIQNAASYSYHSCGEGQSVLLEQTGETILCKEVFLDGAGNQIQELQKTGAGWNVLDKCCFDPSGRKIAAYLPFYRKEAELVDDLLAPAKIWNYDAAGRSIEEAARLWQLCDGSSDYGYSRTDYQITGYTSQDINGTLKDAPYYRRFLELYPEDADWALQERKRVLEKAASFHGNYHCFYHDSAGHLEKEIPYDGMEIYHQTDLAQKTRKIYSLESGKQGHLRMSYVFGMDGSLMRTEETAGGSCMELANIYGVPIHSWDGEGAHKKLIYDSLMQLLTVERDADGITERYIYGGTGTEFMERNQVGRLVKICDGAGTLEYSLYDISGKPLETNRRLCGEYKNLPDWSADPALLEEAYKESRSYDLLGRVTSIQYPTDLILWQDYNEAGFVSEMKLQKKEQAPELFASFDYYPNRTLKCVFYGNGVKRFYEQEPETQLLSRVRTLDGQGKTAEDFHYFFDPMGNISYVCDQNGEDVYYKQQKAAAQWDYSYDSAYRLICASGREKAAGADTADFEKLVGYLENYQYDLAGNRKKMTHQAPDNRWSREVEYAEDSCRLIKEGEQTLRYDGCGNLREYPGIRKMQWKAGRLCSAEIITREDEAGDCEYYTYDYQGNRVRKVLEKKTAAGTEITETRYLENGFEEKRITTKAVILERSCTNITWGSVLVGSVYHWQKDDQSRECKAGACRTHYKAADSLNLSTMDFDEKGNLILRREYYPFGGEAFRQGEAEAKLLADYGYCSKEKDSATGFSYMGQRYYSDRWGRFISADNMQFVKPEDWGSLNRYVYCRNNPRNFVDPDGNDIYYFIFQNAPDRDAVEMRDDRRALQKVAQRAAVPVHAVVLNNWNEFVDSWNGIQGTKGEHTVILRAHSNTSSILGRPDGEGRHAVLDFSNTAHNPINKNKSIGNLFLLSCNSAFGPPANRASLLGRRIRDFGERMPKGGRIVAARGSVNAGRHASEGSLFETVADHYYLDIVNNNAAAGAVPRGFYRFTRTGKDAGRRGTFTGGFWKTAVTTTQIADTVVPQQAPAPAPAAARQTTLLQRTGARILRRYG